MTSNRLNCNRFIQDNPTLRFAPDAWAKLLFFRDRRDVEIGGFGITDDADPLLVREFVTVKQSNSMVTVGFDDQAVAEFFEDQVDQGRQPHQFARIWVHSHPGECPRPSGVDEETFERVFGSCDWAVMFIIARCGDTYVRLHFSVGPGGSVLLPVQVDYGAPFGASDQQAWAKEYDGNIHRIKAAPKRSEASHFDAPFDCDDLFDDPELEAEPDDLFDVDFSESEVIRQW